MILHRRELYLSCLLLLLMASTMEARRAGHRRTQQKRLKVKFTPLLRSVDSDDDYPATGTLAPEKRSSGAKLMLLKPAVAGKGLQPDTNSGRTFKHLLMANGLFGGGCNYCGGGGSGGGGGGGGNGGGGFGNLPYIIFNSPTNVTNINENNLTNSFPTTPTTAANGARIRNRYNALQAMPVPIPIQLPTQVYQQRENGQQLGNVASAIPVMMLGVNGEMIPVLLPSNAQQFYGGTAAGGNKRRGGMQRWRGNQRNQQQNDDKDNHNNHNHHNNDNLHGHNPFEVLANSLKRIQYL